MILSNDTDRIWLFDYDLTLYAESERAVLNSLDRRIALYVQQVANVDYDHAQEIRKRYWKEYGTTLAGLRAVYGVTPNDFFDFIHQPETLVYPDFAPQKRALLEILKGPKYIFTNGRSDWSRKGSSKMGILDCFKRIVGLEDMNWDGKPQVSAYETMEKVLEYDGVWKKGDDPSRIVLLDDALHNLRPAHDRGWKTIWINPISKKNNNFTNFHIPNLINLLKILG